MSQVLWRPSLVYCLFIHWLGYVLSLVKGFYSVIEDYGVWWCYFFYMHVESPSSIMFSICASSSMRSSVKSSRNIAFVVAFSALDGGWQIPIICTSLFFLMYFHMEYSMVGVLLASSCAASKSFLNTIATPPPFFSPGWFVWWYHSCLAWIWIGWGKLHLVVLTLSRSL